MWFVFTLALLKIIYQWIPISRISLIVYSLIMSTIAYFVAPLECGWAITNMCVAFPIFAIGVCVGKIRMNNVAQRFYTKKLNALIYAFIIFIIIYFLASFQGKTRMYYGGFGENIILFYLLAILGSFAIFLLSVAVEHIHWRGTELIATGSLVILAFHRDLNHPLEKIIENYYSQAADILTLVSSIIVLLTFIPIVYFCRHYIPFIIGFRK